MYDYVKGTVTHSYTSSIVLECQNVGFLLNTTERWQQDLHTNLLQEILAYIHMQIKENELILYGFPSREERDCFRILISFSGVGPKTALAILNLYSLSQLLEIAQTENIRAIASVPGIGKKTAEKLMIDFKQKLVALMPTQLNHAKQSYAPVHGGMEEGTHVLMNLGYKKPVAEHMLKQAIAQASEDASLEELVATALKMANVF